MPFKPFKKPLVRQISFALCVLSLLSAASISRAHTELVRVSPANNAMLMSLPEAIELEFSQEVTLTQLALTNRMSKAPVDIGFEPSTQAKSSYQLELPVLEVGTYLIEWTILGADGHRISDSAGFMLHSDGVNVMDMSLPMTTPETSSELMESHSKMTMDDDHQGHH